MSEGVSDLAQSRCIPVHISVCQDLSPIQSTSRASSLIWQSLDQLFTPEERATAEAPADMTQQRRIQDWAILLMAVRPGALQLNQRKAEIE
jgi:hypothetical protein